MTLLTICIDFVLAVLLYFFIRYFTKNDQIHCDGKETILTYILLPLIYIIVLSGIFTSLHLKRLVSNIYLVVLFECVFRFFVKHDVLRKNTVSEWKDYLVTSIVSVLSAFLLYQFFISKVDHVFPDPEQFKIILWFLILSFLYLLFKDHFKQQVKVEKKLTFVGKEDYIVMRYALFKNQFSSFVVDRIGEDFFVSMVYAMMIYEDYLHPEFYRKIQMLKGKFQKGFLPYGIMQVLSHKVLDDEKSIKLAIEKLDKLYHKVIKEAPKRSKEKTMEALLYSYRKDLDYVQEIQYIYEQIVEFNKK